jgi:hypothetical protein
VTQTLEQCVRLEKPYASCREFDRERYAVELTADLGDNTPSLVV